MASNKKPRKAYRPRPVLADTMGFVKDGLTTLPAYCEGEQHRHLLLKTWAALDEIRDGRGGPVHASMLLGALEVAEVLAHEQSIGTDAMPIIAKARPAILGMIHEGERSGSFKPEAPALANITRMLHAHEQQLAACSVGVLDLALQFLRRQDGRPPKWLQRTNA